MLKSLVFLCAVVFICMPSDANDDQFSSANERQFQLPITKALGWDFMDQTHPNINDYRVTAGVGRRLTVPAMKPLPKDFDLPRLNSPYRRRWEGIGLAN